MDPFCIGKLCALKTNTHTHIHIPLVWLFRYSTSSHSRIRFGFICWKTAVHSIRLLQRFACCLLQLIDPCIGDGFRRNGHASFDMLTYSLTIDREPINRTLEPHFSVRRANIVRIHHLIESLNSSKCHQPNKLWATTLHSQRSLRWI